MAGPSGIPSYSVTPAVNATADGGASNWAENQAPSTVNNTARQNLADIRTAFNDLAWFAYGSGDQGSGGTFLGTPYIWASASSVTIAGADVTIPHHAGRRMKFVGAVTGTIYGTIASSVYSSGTTTTTINLTLDAGGALTNETLNGYLSQIPVTGKPVPGATIMPPLVFSTTTDFSPTNIVDITQNINGAARAQIYNGSGGAVAVAQFAVTNGTDLTQLRHNGMNFTLAGVARPDGGMVMSNGTGGLTVGTFSGQPIYFATGSVEVARFDASGQLGIGMVPQRVLDITQNVNGGCSANLTNPNTGTAAYATYYVSNSATASFLMQFGTGYTPSGVNRADGFKICGTGAGGLTIGTNNAQPLYFITNNGEVGRFDATGNLYVGVTASLIGNPRLQVYQANAGRQGAEFINVDATQEVAGFWSQATSGNNAFLFFYTEGAVTTRGSVTFNRGAGLVAYNTTSDERLKSQFDASGIDWGNTIDSIWVGDFVMDGATCPTLGIVAQRTVGIFDQCLTPPSGDSDLWHADYSQLAPLALWGVKDARARITALEARVTALEASNLH